MNLNEFIESALNMEQQLLVEAVQDLTAEELTWQPGADANPMGWMLWHTIRVEDMWIQFFIQRQVELWERDGWHEKFGLPTRDNGRFGHTPEQVAGGLSPALDVQELLRYGEAVRAGVSDAGTPARITSEVFRRRRQSFYRPRPPGAAAQPDRGGRLPPIAGRVLPAPTLWTLVLS